MPFGVYGNDALAQGTGGPYSAQSVQANNSPFSPQSQFHLGGGNPAYYGPGQDSTATRRFADVGKVQLNLLDPLSQSRAAAQYQPIDPAPVPDGPLGGIGHYYDPATPGGLFSGLLGAAGQTLGGIIGQGQAGSQIGEVLGKTIEAPLGMIGGVGLPFLAPVIDQANSAIEEHSPYILRDTLKIPNNLGGAFQSLLNVVGLAGRAVERTYVGLFRGGATDLPQDIQARVDSGELTHDQALDELTVSHRGFTNDPLQNLVFELVTDPVNWLSLGVGAVGGAIRGTAAVGEMFGGAVRAAEEGSNLARLAEQGASAGEVGRLAAKARAGEGIVDDIRGRDTLAQMRSAIDDSGARMHLGIVQRLGMSALGPVSEESAQGIVKVGEAILRATNPLNFFSGSKAGQRSMQLLRTAASTGVYAALKPLVVNDLLDISDKIVGGGSDRILKGIGSWGGNAMQEVASHDLANQAVKDNAIPRFGTLNSTEATRSTLTGGAYDTNIGKHIEIHVEKTKDLTIGTLPYQEMYTQTVNKLAAVLGTTPDKVIAHLPKVSQDLAIAVHGIYYYTKGMELHGNVMTALNDAEAAGTLAKHIKPSLLTMISPRTLTKERLAPLQALLKKGSVEDIRTEIEKYNDFNWANRTSLPDADLKDTIQRWVDTNGPTITSEVPLRDAAGNFLPDVPKELQDWARDSGSYGYSLGEKIPGDAPLEAQWRVTRNAKGTMINATPWLDFMSEEGDPVKRLNMFQAYRMASTRSIRQERILWQQRRAFITDMAHGSESHGVDLPPKLSERIYQSLMYTAQERNLLPRGMAPEEMMDAVHSVIDDVKKTNSQWDNIGGQITERQIVLGFLRAMQGDVGLVGVTQKITGGIKAYGPGSASNFWGRLSERLYPLMRFTLNPIFQAMEFTEPYVLNAMRGVGLPLRRNSDGFQQGLATRNAVDQLVRNSEGPDGMLAETAEALAIGSYQKAEAAAKFGGKTWWGRIGLPGGNRLLKEAAVGLEARRLIGDNMYEAFKQIKGDQFEAFWGDLQYEYKTVNKAEIADRWIASHFMLSDADGNRVALVTDLMNHKNIGQHLRLSKDGRPGVYTFGDVEALLDATRRYQGTEQRAARGLKSGEALIADLKGMSNADWHAEIEHAGLATRVGKISNSQADDIYRLANGPTPKEFWKGYRSAFLRGVKGVVPPGASAAAQRVATRAARDKEQKFAQELVRGWASHRGMTEEEFLALHSDGVPTYTENVANVVHDPAAHFDIRGDWGYQAQAAGGSMVLPAADLRMAYDAGDVHPLHKYVDDAVAQIHEDDPGEFLYATPSHVKFDLATQPGSAGQLGGWDMPFNRDPRQTIENTYEDGPLIRIRKDTLDLTDQGDGQFASNGHVMAGQHHVEVLTKAGWMGWDRLKRASEIAEQRGPLLDPRINEIYSSLPVKPGSEAGAALYKADLEAIMGKGEKEATGAYTGSTYEYINKWLRGFGIDSYGLSEDDLRRMATNLDFSMQRGQLAEETKLWRGVNLRDYKTAQHGKPDTDYLNLKVGDDVYDPAFVSTSQARHVAEDFAGNSPGPMGRSGILLHYTMPAGTHANYMALHEIEDEIILGRQRTFKVVKVIEHDASDSGYREIYVTPVSEELPPGVLHMPIGNPPLNQLRAARFVSDATHDPKELIRLARAHPDPTVAAQSVAYARQAIERAEETGPAIEDVTHGGRRFGLHDPVDVADEIESVMPTDMIRAHSTLLSDFRGRLRHLLETSHPHDSWTGQQIAPRVVENNDQRVLASLAATLPTMGLRAGLAYVSHTMNDIWNNGIKVAESGVYESAAVADRINHQITTFLLRGNRQHIPFPWLEARTHDAADALSGNVSRGATGRVSPLMPIIADDAAAEGAGYMTRDTFKGIVDEHGVPDPDNPGLVRLTNEATGEVRLVDPETLDYVVPEGGLSGTNVVAGAPEAFPEAALETQAPVTIGDTTFKQGLKGTTGPIQTEDARGRLYVEKAGASEGHVAEEHYANDVYSAMGVPVPAQDLVQVGGHNVQRANFIEGATPLAKYLQTASAEEEAAIIRQIQQPFALDALLGNWDVVGLEGDNILVKDGVAYRVDNGGSLRYRAQGALKGAGSWNERVGEIHSMRSGGNMWQKHVFGSLSDADLRRQILDLADQRTTILAALPPELRQIVGARLNDMLDETSHIAPSAETTIHMAPEVRTPGFQTLNDYDHEYLTKFYNDLAGELNTRGSGGYKEWTAADAAILAGRSRELRGRPVGTVLNPAELDRATTNITSGVYPGPDSANAHLTPGLRLLNQPRNRVQRQTFISGVTADTNRAIRDEYGIIVDNSETARMGGFDTTEQPMMSTQTLLDPQQARDMADVMSYATQTPDMITFINEATPQEIIQQGKNFRDYTAQGVVIIPESVGPRMADKIELALGQNLPWGTRGMKSRTVPGVGRRIEIIDHDGNFPRQATGEVDGNVLQSQLAETLNGIPSLPDTNFDMDVEYGSHHISGPERQPDGTYNWEGYGDAVHRDLQTRGATAGRESLDRVRNAHDKSVERNFRDVSPQNYDRLQQGLPPTNSKTVEADKSLAPPPPVASPPPSSEASEPPIPSPASTNSSTSSALPDRTAPSETPSPGLGTTG